MSFFSAVLGFINKFKNQNKNKNEIVSLTKFSEFLYDVSDDTQYQIVKHTIILCNKALIARGQKIYLSRKLKEYQIKLDAVDCYNKLSEDDAKELKSLIEKFVSLTKERNILRYQVVDFDKNINKFQDIEDVAENAVDKMREAEYNQRIFKQDIGYLQMEKENLKDEQDKLFFALNFIYKFSVAMLFLFGIGTIILTMSNIFNNQTVFFSLSIMAVLVIIVISLIYFFRRKLTFELKMNRKKQEKLIKILSRKNVLYAHYTNFLNFEYKKFKVKSSDMLVNHLKEYDNYKHITSRYDSIRNIMYQTQELLEKFIKEKNIQMDNVSIEKFAATVSVDDKIEYCREINSAKAEAEAKIKSVEKKYDEIWNQILDIKNRDWSGKEIIDNLVNAFIREVEKADAEIDINENYNTEIEEEIMELGELDL